jgi:glycosyltransferase involved in cell wall biosynthesis
MRVLLVSHHAPPHLGGVEQLVRLEAEALVAAGHAVHWSTSDGSGAGAPVPEREGLRIERLRASHLLERRFGIAYPLFGPGMCLRIWRAVGAADLVHVHGMVFPNSIVAAVCARLRGRRCVLTDHGGLLRYRSRFGTLALRILVETLGRLSARCADRILVLNADLERLMVRLSGRRAKVEFLPNPIDPGLFRRPRPGERDAARARLGWNRRPRLLFVGRVLPHKGVDLVLGLVGPDWEVVLVGPAEPAMRERIAAAGAVHLPPCAQHELVSIYHAADVLVLPSHNEGFPLVIQEALACGLPAIARDAEAYAPYRELAGLDLAAAEPDALRAAVRRALAAGREAVREPPWLGPAAWVARVCAVGEGGG